MHLAEENKIFIMNKKKKGRQFIFRWKKSSIPLITHVNLLPTKATGHCYPVCYSL